MFHYATNFTAPLFRIKINSIQLKETVEENKKTNDQVLQDRQYQVSASVGLASPVWPLLLVLLCQCGHCCCSCSASVATAAGPAWLEWPLLMDLFYECDHCCWPCHTSLNPALLHTDAYTCPTLDLVVDSKLAATRQTALGPLGASGAITYIPWPMQTVFATLHVNKDQSCLDHKVVRWRTLPEQQSRTLPAVPGQDVLVPISTSNGCCRSMLQLFV